MTCFFILSFICLRTGFSFACYVNFKMKYFRVNINQLLSDTVFTKYKILVGEILSNNLVVGILSIKRRLKLDMTRKSLRPANFMALAQGNKDGALQV
jgi:hypothetical protein